MPVLVLLLGPQVSFSKAHFPSPLQKSNAKRRKSEKRLYIPCHEAGLSPSYAGMGSTLLKMPQQMETPPLPTQLVLGLHYSQC